MNLEKRLQHIVETKNLEVDDLMDLTNEMLTQIGDPNPKLRDDLIYTVFSKLLMNKSYSNEQLKTIANVILDDNHLFNDLNGASTSVYTRTFSVLILAPIIYLHRQELIFTESELRVIYQEVLRYFNSEQDLHGYTKEYGWAHSVAHTADVIDEFALCHELHKSDLEDILKAVQNKVAVGSYIYCHGEDDRLTIAIMSVLSRELLSEEELINWVNSFKELPKCDDWVEEFAKKTNIKNLLRSIYFSLAKEDKYPLLKETIIQY